MNNGRFIFLFALTLFSSLLVIGQEGNQDVNQGSQATTLKGATVRFKPGTANYRPHFTITKEDALNLAMSGLQSAADLTPSGELIGRAVDVEDVLMETAQKSVDHANEDAGAQVILLTKDARRLEDLYKSGADLKKNDEAQKIIAGLNAIPKGEQDNFYFAWEAIVSPYGKTTLVKEIGAKVFTNFLGEKLADKLAWGDKAALLWRGDEKPSYLIRSQWKKLKKQSYLVGKYVDNLEEELYELSLEKFINSEFDEALNTLVDNIAARSASKHERAIDLRLQINVHPEPVLRMLRPAVAEIHLVAVPPRMLKYAEPLVNSLAIEQQVIAAQHYPQRNPSGRSSSDIIYTDRNSNTNTSSENSPSRQSPPPSFQRMNQAVDIGNRGFDGNNIGFYGN